MKYTLTTKGWDKGQWKTLYLNSISTDKNNRIWLSLRTPELKNAIKLSKNKMLKYYLILLIKKQYSAVKIHIFEDY